MIVTVNKVPVEGGEGWCSPSRPSSTGTFAFAGERELNGKVGKTCPYFAVHSKGSAPSGSSGATSIFFAASPSQGERFGRQDERAASRRTGVIAPQASSMNPTPGCDSYPRRGFSRSLAANSAGGSQSAWRYQPNKGPQVAGESGTAFYGLYVPSGMRFGRLPTCGVKRPAALSNFIELCPKCGYPYYDCVCHPQWMSICSPPALQSNLTTRLGMAASVQRGTAHKPVTCNSGRTMSNSGDRGDSRKDGTNLLPVPVLAEPTKVSGPSEEGASVTEGEARESTIPAPEFTKAGTNTLAAGNISSPVVGLHTRRAMHIHCAGHVGKLWPALFPDTIL